MSAEFWAIIGVGIMIALTIDGARKRIQDKLDILIEEVRYPNLEAQLQDLRDRTR